ncbi:amino acid:proton symporter, partial [Staphylococcus cohnii]
RKMAPKMHRPFRANLLKFMAPFSFVMASLAIYWAMWPTTAEVILIIILGLPIYFFYEYKMNWKNTKKQIGGSLWIILYLIVLAFLSFIGSKEFKGMNWIHYPYDFIVIIIIALIFYKIGTSSYFESVYFKRAKKINKDMRADLREKRKSEHI